ncbi:MAG: staygreen family protein [Nitrososphaerales archaeon]
MSRLNPAKLHVRWGRGVTPQGPIAPRRYTLTHSDATGDLFLTIAGDYDRKQVSGLYTRLMRDEVLAEWENAQPGPCLRIFCHVSGGLVFGSAGMRDEILRRELPLVIEALRYGDRELFTARPELDRAPILVVFQSHLARYNRVEPWGVPADYRVIG